MIETREDMRQLNATLADGAGLSEAEHADLLDLIEALRKVARKAEWNVGQGSCPICGGNKESGHGGSCPYVPLPDWITEE